MERRKHSRHAFECLALEHRPQTSKHPQATRVLKCLDFSVGGLKLEGKPRYERFRITLSAPQDGSKIDAVVETIYTQDNYFGVRFVEPSKELISKLSWWNPAASHGRDGDTSS